MIPGKFRVSFLLNRRTDAKFLAVNRLPRGVTLSSLIPQGSVRQACLRGSRLTV
jgi:hypothetical protein